MDSNVKKGIAFSKNPILLRSSLTVDDYNPITGIPFTVYAEGMDQPIQDVITSPLASIYPKLWMHTLTLSANR